MRTNSTRRLAVLAGMVLLIGATALWASGATFAITGTGIALGESKEGEEGGQVLHRFVAKATVGVPFTLTAQGLFLPRGGKATPGQPESGAWSFDDQQFKKLVATGPADKTKVAVRLEPTKAGMARARFAGKILGYHHVYEILIHVAAKP